MMITKFDLKRCNTEQPFILISYSSRDQDLVISDAYELQRRGYNIWIDEKMLDKTNPSWREQVLSNIRSLNCKMVLFYVSKRSLTSVQCYKEISYTMSEEAKKRHRLKAVPIAIVDTEPIGDILAYYNEICEDIEDSSLAAREKDDRIETASRFIEEVFDSNNERVRIHSKDWPDRKVDYYSDIEEVLPARTHLSEEDQKKAKGSPVAHDWASTEALAVENTEERMAAQHPEASPEEECIDHRTEYEESQGGKSGLFKKGNIITFGRYPQDTVGIPAPIEWQVLDLTAEGEALLVSRYALACRRYNETGEDVTWETCSLNAWLNENFYSSAFNAEEKEQITSIKIPEGKNAVKCVSSIDKSGKTRVFLLSIPEVSRYFASDRARACKATKLATGDGGRPDEKDGNCCWWLRSPGPGGHSANTIPHSGTVGFFGTDVCSSCVCVRPALWVRP